MPAGYSGTPLPKKLGIKPDFRLLFVGEPPGFIEELQPFPSGAEVARDERGPFDLVVLFVKTEAELRKRFVRLASKLQPAGMLWVAWPKKASGVVTDLTFDVVQKTGLAVGLVDVKICAVSEVWSGLKFVIRVENRPPKSGRA